MFSYIRLSFKIGLVFLLAVMVSGCVNIFGPNSGVVKGIIVDNNGNPVSGAMMIAERQKLVIGGDYSVVEPDPVTTMSNSKGEYSMTVPLGEIKITASKMEAGFMETVERIEVKQNGSSIPTHVVNMELDGSPTLSDALVSPRTVSLLVDDTVTLQVLYYDNAYPDLASVKVKLYDQSDQVQKISTLFTLDIGCPALFTEELFTFDIEPGEYKVEFVAADEFGNKSNVVTSSLTVVE